MTTADPPETLLPRAAQGDQQAWIEIVLNRYTNLLWSIGRAHRLDSAAIGDVIQNTWLRLLENLDRIREPARLASWLATTARRECLSSLRQAGRESPDWRDDAQADVADSTIASIDSLLLLEERDAYLWRCLSNCPTVASCCCGYSWPSTHPAIPRYRCPWGSPVRSAPPACAACSGCVNSPSNPATRSSPSVRSSECRTPDSSTMMTNG